MLKLFDGDEVKYILNGLLLLRYKNILQLLGRMKMLLPDYRKRFHVVFTSLVSTDCWSIFLIDSAQDLIFLKVIPSFHTG